MKRIKKYCELGKLIGRRLVDLDKSKIWLSESTQIQPSLISKYCTGQAIPSTISVYKLSETLEVDVNDIIHAIINERNREK